VLFQGVQFLFYFLKYGRVVFFQGQLQKDLGIVQFLVQPQEIPNQRGDLFLFFENVFCGFRVVPEFGVFLTPLQFVQARYFTVQVKDNL